MPLKKLFKFLRGAATPFQIWAACLLGAFFGFLPGFVQTPGLFLFFLAVLVVLNANLFLAAITSVLCSLLALALLPVSFALGRFLIDGPTQGLWTILINGPVTAWFGFENYTASGGLLLGLVIGSLIAWQVTRLLQGFRRKMGQFEEGSEAYKKWSSKGWVKVIAWVLIGGLKGKKSFSELAELKGGKPYRPLGIVLIVLLCIVGFVSLRFLDTNIVTAYTREALERVNGATVDLEEIRIDLADGRVSVSGLAMADPDQLQQDLFRAREIVAALDTSSLLRKKLAIETLEITGGSSGQERRVPGRLTQPRPKPAAEPVDPSEGKSLEDYLENARQWRDRLAQAQSWLDRIMPSEADEDAAPGRPGGRPSLRDELQRRAELLGYRNVTATHRIQGAPTLTIHQLAAREVNAAQMPGTTLDITGRNLSTQPWLLNEAPALRVASSDDTLLVDLSLTGAQTLETAARLQFHYKNLSVDNVKKQLASGVSLPVEGGSIDLNASGGFSPQALDLPVEVTIKDSRIAGTPLSLVTVPLKLEGSLSSPRILLAEDALQKALMDAGRGAVADRLQKEAGQLLEGREEGSGEGASGLLRGLIPSRD